MHAVEHRENDRLWPYCWREVIDCGGKAVAFYAQKDDVIRRSNLSYGYCLGSSGEIAMHWADDLQSLSLDLLGAFRPD
jgi:hypothetical protein